MIIWGRVRMSCGQKGGEKEMEDLPSHRANLRNSPDRRIDFSAWKFAFWDLVFMLSQNTIINKHEVASLGLAAGSHHLISADYNFA